MKTSSRDICEGIISLAVILSIVGGMAICLVFVLKNF